MPLCGAKYEHFSCFHSSWQLGLMLKKKIDTATEKNYLLSHPKGFMTPVNDITVKKVLCSLLSNYLKALDP